MASRLARLGWIVSSGPAMLLGALVLHALSVRLYLARWPIVYKDSPETVSLQLIEYGLVVPLLYGSMFVVPLWLPAGLVLGVVGHLRWRLLIGQLVLIATGVAGIILLATFDPTGYVEWFLD